jgi:predicted transglutaminase-like cysteine proteinase
MKALLKTPSNTVMTPTIYKIAYVDSTVNDEGFVLFHNDGNTDIVLDKFGDEGETLRHLENYWLKVGQITDYGLYIRKSYLNNQ